MTRILRLYVIRAIVTPTVMALVTIVFMLLVNRINMMIDLIMQPGVSLGQVAGVLVAFLPWMITFAAPMAVLVGTMIGVGRLVMDREVLAMRASGINLLSVFAPALIGALLISGIIFQLSQKAVPRSLNAAYTRISDLNYALFNTLKPGQKYTSEDLKMKDTNFEMYFHERDETRHEMRELVMRLNPDKKSIMPEDKKKDKTGDSEEDEKEKKKERKKKKQADAATSETLAADMRTSTTAEIAAEVTRLHEQGLLPVSIKQIEYNKELMRDLTKVKRDEDNMMIFAHSGRLMSELEHRPDGKIYLMFRLALRNGSLHLKSADPAKRQYVTFRFDNTTITQTREDAMGRETKMMTNAELRQDLEKATEGGRKAGEAKAELIDRKTMPLAFFVFMLMGVPLAIRVRTGGKSWAILLAIGMMLVYFVLMQMGQTMVGAHKPLGVAVACFPNLLFIALGSLLWWQTLRS